MHKKWQKPVLKKNGGARRQFQQWTIPAEIRKTLGLEDGSECTISARLGAYSSEPKEYVLTSGGEIRLSKSIADVLESHAKAYPTEEIVFDLDIRDLKLQSEEIEKARRDADNEQAFDPPSVEDARNRILASIVRRQGQPHFRKQLLTAYNNRCAISDCDCTDALEAAHISPYMGEHTNYIHNGILLRSDIHTLFDLGKINISSEYKVRVCDDLLSTVYKEFHNKQVHLPKDKRHWPKIGAPIPDSTG